MTSSTSTKFEIGDVTFRCFAVEDSQRFEWQADDGLCVAGRNVGNGSYWARCGDTNLGNKFGTLKAAMRAAVVHKAMQEAA